MCFLRHHLKATNISRSTAFFLLSLHRFELLLRDEVKFSFHCKEQLLIFCLLLLFLGMFYLFSKLLLGFLNSSGSSGSLYLFLPLLL